eukprot:1134902-Pyramimonas_sp.AAC.1
MAMTDDEMTHAVGGSEVSDDERERQSDKRGGIGEDPQGAAAVPGDDADEDSCSESQALTCCACGITSKDDDPVSAKKAAMAKGNKVVKTIAKVSWGKSSTRKVRTRSGRIVRKKRSSGEWRRLCLNNCRRHLTKNKKYVTILKKHGKRAATKKLKDDLVTDQSFSGRWQSELDEQAHLLAGGRSRIHQNPVKVETADEQMIDLVDDGMVFMELWKYKRDIGDPR